MLSRSGVFRPFRFRIDAERRIASPIDVGTGAGRALIQAVYDAGDAMGCPTVYWMTENDNHTAMKLYDRMAKHSLYRPD